MNRHCLDEQVPPQAMATYFYEFVLREPVALNPRIRHWLGPNEQVFIWSKEQEWPLIDGRPNPQYDPARAAALQAQRELVMRWYAQFLNALARILWQGGRRLVFGNWSVGHPHVEWRLWPHYAPALQACRDYGAVHACHAYGPLTEQSALRYRADYREFARLGYSGTPIVLTECGAENEAGMLPWKRQYGGDVDRYFNEWVRPFALSLEDDDYVQLAALFTSGGAGWPDYDITGTDLAGRMVAWCESRDVPKELDMTPDDLQAIADHAAAIEAIAQRYLAPAPPPPWWNRPAPYQFKAQPNPALKLYRADLATVDRTMNYTGWLVDVFEVKPDGWLRLTGGNTPGAAGLWVDAGQVQPV